jgi:uncharacterized protein YkwD
MTHQKLTVASLLGIIVLVGTASLCAQNRTSPRAAATPEQRRQVARLVAEFRRARNDPQRRAHVVRQALELGTPAVTALQEAIGRELFPKVEKYRERFRQRGSAALSKRLGRVNFDEVARLRAAVLGLQQAPDFSKQAIVQRADPAVRRLEEILLIDPRQILAASKDLQTERRQLAVLGQWWEQCTAYLARETPRPPGEQAPVANFAQYLAGEEELAVGLAAPTNGTARQVMLSNARLAAQLDPEEARVVSAVNRVRSLLGLRPLLVDLKLCAAAREHSQDMQRLNFFSHTSPVPGKQTPMDRARRQGTTAGAENIYQGATSGQVAHDFWFHSPAHHKNILGNHARLGIGRSGVFFTEMFGR